MLTETKEKTLQTKIHTYKFDVGNPEEKKQYLALRERLQSDGRDFFNVLAMPGKDRLTFDSPDIELETSCLFSNQWNTACGKRVFDWYEAIYPNRKIKEGHYLEITDEMRAIRQTTLVCGYCGRNYPNGTAGTFCKSCLDSEYLKETDLHLLRLLPVAYKFSDRDPLTDTERVELLPQYVARQTIGNDSRAVKAKLRTRQNVEKKYCEKRDANESEYAGMVWLLDRNINTENCIYYSHTGKFCFGWRNPVSASVKSALLDILVEFPFEYEIKG